MHARYRLASTRRYNVQRKTGTGADVIESGDSTRSGTYSTLFSVSPDQLVNLFSLSSEPYLITVDLMHGMRRIAYS